MSNNIEGKIVVITGASSGLGEATARLLSAQGACVILGARRVDRIQSLADELTRNGGKALAVPTDVTYYDQVKSLVDAAVQAYGRIDVMINNAGLMPHSPLERLKVEDWEQMIDVNLKGVLYGIAAALPYAGVVAGDDRAANSLKRVGQKALPVRANSVFQRASVDLDGIWRPPFQTAREDHGAHHQMIGERDVWRRYGSDRGDVDVEVVAERRLVDVRERQRIKALIVISHVDGKQAPNVGHVDCHAVRRQCRPVLAEQVHLMAQSSQRSRQVGVVDVATGAAQQVAMENEDPHVSLLFPGRLEVNDGCWSLRCRPWNEPAVNSSTRPEAVQTRAASPPRVPSKAGRSPKNIANKRSEVSAQSSRIKTLRSSRDASLWNSSSCFQHASK